MTNYTFPRRVTSGQPWLIQRMVATKNPSGTTVDDHFKFEYMGSAEFEWGALPSALKDLRNSKHLLSVSVVTLEHPSTKEQKQLYFVGTNDDYAGAVQWLKSHLAGSSYTKEQTYISNVLDWTTHVPTKYRYKPDTTGWWAIDAKIPWAIFISADLAERWINAVKG